MADPGAAIRLASAARDRAGGPIDILVNAGGASRPVILESPDAEWRDAMQIGFFSPRALTHALLPNMCAGGWGGVVTITGTSEH